MSHKKKGSWRPSLSKNLLEMKFMQKSKVQLEKFELEKKSVFEEELKATSDKQGINYVMEDSFVPCEDLIFGRLSFRGENPEIEKIMRELAAEKEEQRIEERESKGTVSAEEMADRYSTLALTIGKKFQTKRKRDKDENISNIKSKLIKK